MLFTDVKQCVLKSILIKLFLYLLMIGFTLTSVSANDIKDKPQLILLKSYQNQKNINVQNWLMSEKLDGVRAYWDGETLYSRSGKRFAVPNEFTKDFPEFELDGELWTKRGDFEHIVSIVNKKKSHEGWNDIRYYIFEVPNAEGDFTQRLDKIRDYLTIHPSTSIEIIPQLMCKDDQHLESFLTEIEELGGEGVVVRNPNMHYHTGRHSFSLKVKRFQDAECKVTGYKEGKGQFKGLTGALYCQTEELRTITIGSGLTNKEREKPPEIGTIITFKYYGLTSKGNPRFPVYLRIRKSP